MSVLAERHHDQQVPEHRHDDDDAEEDGENYRLQRVQRLLRLFLLLLSCVCELVHKAAGQQGPKTTG